MKKHISLLLECIIFALAVCMIFSLAACGETIPTEPESELQPVTAGIDYLALKIGDQRFAETEGLGAKALTEEFQSQFLSGEKVDVNDEETYNTGKKIVPSFLCEPVIGTAENYKELLIESGYYILLDDGHVDKLPE